VGYEKPAVMDYGELLELTAALGFFGSEDGGSKDQPNHHGTTLPQLP
jgi:hypothetical protein